MILVTGPTGMAKRPAHAVLSKLNKPTGQHFDAEIRSNTTIAGVTRCRPRSRRTNFSYCLRAFLRQDPDIIMVGEVRTFETAEISIKAALTVTWCLRRCIRTTPRRA